MKKKLVLVMHTSTMPKPPQSPTTSNSSNTNRAQQSNVVLDVELTEYKFSIARDI